MTSTEQDLPAINSNAEIPEFATEEEFTRFWQTHSIGPGLIEAGRNDPEVWEVLNRIAPRQRPRQPCQPKATHVTTLARVQGK